MSPALSVQSRTQVPVAQGTVLLQQLRAIPEGWQVCAIKDIASKVRNAIVGGPFGSELVSNDYVEDGVPVIRGQNMGTTYVSGPYVYVTEDKAKSLVANNARPGDLVFTQRGTLGQVSIVPEQPYQCYHSDSPRRVQSVIEAIDGLSSDWSSSRKKKNRRT